MKRIIIFILLKIAELGGCFLVGWLCVCVGKMATPQEDFMLRFLTGMMILLGIVMLAMMVYVIFKPIIKANWKWADKLSRRIK
jgi:FtsH-binding integral membrane protein